MLTAAIHSSTVISFSRQKSCRCLSRLGVTCFNLGCAFGPVALMTLSVNLGSKRETLGLTGVPWMSIVSSATGSSSAVVNIRGSGTAYSADDIVGIKSGTPGWKANRL